MTDEITVFDRRAVRLHRDRAAPGFEGSDFLRREIGERLLDRLDDVRRKFPMALDLGAANGTLRSLLAGRGGIETLFESDLSARLISQTDGPALVADEEALPFADESFDLILSCLSLHWVNDLPGALIQIRQALKPDGLFLGAMLGGRTVQELRQSLAEAEADIEGGLSPRTSPMAEVRDAGNLLLRAGFALPVADADVITVSYADPLNLMTDLRAMGENNAAAGRRKSFSRRATLAAAAERYRDTFADADGRIPATFEVVFLTAWAPHPSQPQPLKPGSANQSLADFLEPDRPDK
jgi:NADH dehydrogenase [ubiquinone] 1 alpha subcomplex assembly factor 5